MAGLCPWPARSRSLCEVGLAVGSWVVVGRKAGPAGKAGTGAALGKGPEVVLNEDTPAPRLPEPAQKKFTLVSIPTKSKCTFCSKNHIIYNYKVFLAERLIF